MKLGIIDVDWEQVGAMLAQSDDVKQAKYF